MNFNDEEKAILASPIKSVGFFFRLETDPIVRIWLGFGDIEPGINAYDLTGAVYSGLGSLQGVPEHKVLINGKAARVEFVASGVSGKILEIAAGGDATQVRGKRASSGFALLRPDYSLAGPVHWNANYKADYLTIEQDESGPDGTLVRSVKLSCGTLLVSRWRPSLGYFTNKDQSGRYLGDRFCERTTIYATGQIKAWPTFPP